ncbi:MAG: DUF502 domain-containing protein [Desulfobacteraceae bacterium]|nr:DUF502 domain-containing protein [Desulfobacteraceae bacterium]MDH3721270.1 DUF502 domain-containing protein [Desulfobacteraceae bacterium]MDH3835861.1 DUF502 domain-containing protein [Desulfobacteraceae bacterium]MDH3873540.1 DUF502 domain-containing protein [Desulfobacteraceae bacterium]MDH3880347.1 DUF502 domain-containing protein [Desulfobacteraceae bacterium]
MKQLIEFLKTTALGGLFVLLPVLLLYLLLSEALGLIVALATPIADLFPKGTFDEINHPVAMGLILIMGVSFVIGLALRSENGRRLGRWIERTVLDRLPVYKALKSLTSGFTEAGKDGAFKTAVLNFPAGEREIVYIVEDHGNGYLTVLQPWAPTAFSGSVKVVNQDRLEILDANIGDVSRALSHWGVGVRELLEKKTTDVGSSGDPPEDVSGKGVTP